MNKYIAHTREVDGITQSLEDHLLGVAKLTSQYASKIGLQQQGELIGLLHDLGKYSNAFQNYLKSATGLLNQDDDEEFVDTSGLKGKIDHSTAGAQLIWRSLGQKGLLGQIVGQIMGLCIASHHSGLIDCIASDSNNFGKDNFTRRMSKQNEKTHIEEVLINLDRRIDVKFRKLIDEPALLDDFKRIISQITKTAGTNDKSLVVQLQIGLLVRILFSCLIDADRVDTADFEQPKLAKNRQYNHYKEWSYLLNKLERYFDEIEPRRPIDTLRNNVSIQCRNAADRPQGIYTLTVPTGGGKTLASLRFALHHAHKYHLDRIIYVIPFTSIIDQNAEVVRKILVPQTENENQEIIILEHHSNLTPESQSWREKMLTENWDAPIIYTTMVQFLETLFGSGTRGARRMHQLANSVIIFDEIQTLPIKCVHLFNNAINFLATQCNSTVVLCTATQPLLDKVDIRKGAMKITDRGELITDVKKLFEELNRVEIVNLCKPSGWSDKEIVDLALEEVNSTGSCLVIVNTKKAAQTLFTIAKNQSEIGLYHLSTSMCPAHRKHKLAEIIKYLHQKKPILCFSTQLIEAGVDIDFGTVIRSMAGLDSIAQAAGRCNRQGDREIGMVYVLNPQTDEQDLQSLPDIKLGKQQTERVFNDYMDSPDKFANRLLGPEAISWYYQNYFFARIQDMDYPLSVEELGHSDSLLALLSTNDNAVVSYKNTNNIAPPIYLKQSFMAAGKVFRAIDTHTQGIIVPYSDSGKALIAKLCGDFNVEKQYTLLREAQQYTVNVFPHVLDQLKSPQIQAIHPIQEGIQIFYLDSRYYSDEFGLTTEAINTMETYCV